MAVGTRLMTTEEFLALPDDDVYRELIRGELKEYPMTTRSAPHGHVMANLSYLLGAWVRQQSPPRGRIYTGEVRFRACRDPDTFVGADLIYLTPEQAAATSPRAKFIDEPPVLVIDLLSPSDQAEDVAQKVDEYRACGVALVWIADPYFRTVTVHRPDAPPVLFNEEQELTAGPPLPGFRAPVAEVFAA